MIGFHVGKAGRNMSTALTQDIKLVTERDMRACAQIFVTGPRNNKETLTAEDKRLIKLFTERYPVVVHGAYVDIPWKQNPGGVLNIKREMEICHEIGASGLIVHLGAGANDDNVLAHVLQEVSTIDEHVRDNVILYLEINTAKPSNNTFETPKKISKLFERIANTEHSLRVGLCIDTAHVFSCGVALDEYNITMNWLNSIQGVSDIMFHLNDSASSLGSGVDKHAALCRGNLWSHYAANNANAVNTTDTFDIRDSGIMAVIEWAKVNNCMVILERNEGLEDDLDLLAASGVFAL